MLGKTFGPFNFPEVTVEIRQLVDQRPGQRRDQLPPVGRRREDGGASGQPGIPVDDRPISGHADGVHRVHVDVLRPDTHAQPHGPHAQPRSHQRTADLRGAGHRTGTGSGLCGW